MNNASKISTPPGRRAPERGIDWEIQPSLQHLVRRTDDEPGPTWAETMPAPLMHDEPAAFREPLEGLSMRDLDEPEIFRVFFGGAALARA